jgi:hypothetical protein
LQLKQSHLAKKKKGFPQSLDYIIHIWQHSLQTELKNGQLGALIIMFFKPEFLFLLECFHDNIGQFNQEASEKLEDFYLQYDTEIA